MRALRWTLASPQRLLAVAVVAVVAVTLVSALVAVVRVQMVAAGVSERADALTQGARERATRERAVTPAAQAGLATVTAWSAGDVDALAAVATPALVEELAVTPAPAGMAVTGAPVQVGAVVQVPTSVGVVHVQVADLGDRWRASTLSVQ